MNKETIEGGYDEYQKKLRLIKKMADDISNEFNLEGKKRVVSNPDQFVVPLVHKDNKEVEHIVGTFKSEGQDTLRTPIKFTKDENVDWIPTDFIIRSLIKYGPDFNSNEPQLIKKCLDKLKRETETNKKTNKNLKKT